MENYKKLIDLLSEGLVDAQKAYEKGNVSAGVRVRKTMQEVKALAQEVRKEISDIKNAK